MLTALCNLVKMQSPENEEREHKAVKLITDLFTELASNEITELHFGRFEKEGNDVLSA